jgi:protein-tyrosine-phosphatase
MARAAQAAGLVLPAHRARSIEHVPALHEFDLILTMARHQQEALQVEFPHLRLRIQLLSALAGPPYDIPDPIGGPPGAYQQTVAELHRLLMDAWPHLCKLLAN